MRCKRVWVKEEYNCAIRNATPSWVEIEYIVDLDDLKLSRYEGTKYWAEVMNTTNDADGNKWTVISLTKKEFYRLSKILMEEPEVVPVEKEDVESNLEGMEV